MFRVLLPERQLPAAERAALADEAAAGNARALRVVAPLLCLVHLANVLVYEHLPTPSEGYRLWATWLVYLHGLAAGFCVLLFAAAAWRPRLPLGDAAALFYLLLGAAMAVNAQRSHGSVHAFVVCALAAAVLVRARPALYASSLAAGCALVVTGTLHLQPERALFWSNTMLVLGLGTAAVTTFFATHLAKTREFMARRELLRLNQDLEGRVQAQVREIVAHAAEVEQLNTQLSEKVKERSEELSRALQRLSGQTTLPPGTVLGERFEIEKPIGVGGMGVVYRGVDRLTKRAVAIKLIQAASAAELDSLHRFLREARATASISHPAVVRSLHVDVSDEGRLYQVMELVEGDALDERLRREGAMPWAVVARLGSVLAEALAAAHAAGIVHRDVKPPNVMLMRSPPGLKLLDFGVSKLKVERLAQAGDTGARLIGTPEFMAPEQIADAATAGEKADVYSLGLVLYQCAAGQGPFAATTPNQWLHAHAVKEPIPLVERAAAVPPELASLVMSCLRKDPAERPAAKELARALGELAAGAKVPALDVLESARPARKREPQSVESEPTLDAPKVEEA